MKRILVLEGMGNFPCIRNQLVEPLIRQGADVEVIYSYWSQWSIHAKNGIKYDAVIGHSLGGHAALLYTLACGYKVKVFVIDGRWADNISWLDTLFAWRKNFTAPLNAEVFAFYQKGPMPGYKVDGAHVNELCFGWHGSMPGQAKVVKALREAL